VSLRFILATLLYPVACSLPAGIGTAFVLVIPALAADAGLLLPYVGAESLVLGAAIAWHAAPAIMREPARPKPVLQPARVARAPLRRPT
jgi:hypothetical protein